MDDIRAVMDAAGSERAALIGMSEGGADVPSCSRRRIRAHAATLVLYGGLGANALGAPDYPLGIASRTSTSGRSREERRQLDEGRGI